jgi:hypothetical protein
MEKIIIEDIAHTSVWENEKEKFIGCKVTSLQVNHLHHVFERDGLPGYSSAMGRYMSKEGKEKSFILFGVKFGHVKPRLKWRV